MIGKILIKCAALIILFCCFCKVSATSGELLYAYSKKTFASQEEILDFVKHLSQATVKYASYIVYGATAHYFNR